MKDYVTPNIKLLRYSTDDVIRTSQTGAGFVETTNDVDQNFAWRWEE